MGELRKTVATSGMLDSLEETLALLRAEASPHRDQEIGLLVCEEALEAARRRNYGVGAILLDPDGQVVIRGRNEAFSPAFRSDGHAEMVVLNAFESRFSEATDMRGFTLVSSLEPCPMCVARMLIAGVQQVKFLASDDLGGMATHLDQLPTAWRRLASRCTFAKADVSEALSELALDTFLLNLDMLRKRLWAR